MVDAFYEAHASFTLADATSTSEMVSFTPVQDQSFTFGLAQFDLTSLKAECGDDGADAADCLQADG